MTEEMLTEILENEGQEGVDNALEFAEEWYLINEEENEL